MIKHVHLNECDSTQNVIKEQLNGRDTAHQLLISCENQSSGRGRGENTWQTMAGTLSFSLTLTPHKIPSFTALELSVLVAKFFETKGEELKLKWPNDLYSKELKKCGGILIQSSNDKMYAGIGINLFSHDIVFGGVYESEFEIDKKNWSKEIAEYIRANRFAETPSLIKEWTARCLHLNKEVTISEASEIFSGTFIGLGEHGEALLKDEQETLRLYNGTLRWN
jgi:BirA family biotin operon repressor/biotin-[acetyl-CoA-carboxylase] ligase